MNAQYCQVVVPVPLRQVFYYQIPPDLQKENLIGKRLNVPFGSRQLIGYCVAVKDHVDLDPKRIRPIDSVLDHEPLLSDKLLKLTRWISDHYLCPWVDVLQAALPAPTRQGRKRAQSFLISLAPTIDHEVANQLQKKSPKQALILDLLKNINGFIEKKELLKLTQATASSLKALEKKKLILIQSEDRLEDPLENIEIDRENPPPLNEDQFKALHDYQQDRSGFFLLQGVTGSGKTEVYLKAIEEVIAQKKQAIVLVPEISLTPQTLRRFRARFDHLAVLHSHLTDAQRAAQWSRIHQGKADVIIGARSALFAPTKNLGLIVVDEEHDSSFKQQNSPRYNARDVAIMRGHFENVPVILGSATPQIESWYNTTCGKSKLLLLPRRVANLPLPHVSIVDMNHELTHDGSQALLARKTILQIKEYFDQKKQTMILLNRRGFSPILRCQRCTDVPKCTRCDISLTVHRSFGKLVCHYCNHMEEIPHICPKCHFTSLKPMGAGTQRIETALKNLIEGIRVLRMDADSTRARGSHQDILDRFRKQEADVLIGTQMIAKGHDFPNVSLVVVANGDIGLTLPDFRSAEKTFSLITQVAGRAGRRDDVGRVLVQTNLPNHYAIQSASHHSFKEFLDAELPFRKQFLYPPYSRLARILIQGPDDEEVVHVSQSCLNKLTPNKSTHILGPASCPLNRIDDRYRHHILLKTPDHKLLHQALQNLINQMPKVQKDTRIAIDIDPVSLL